MSEWNRELLCKAPLPPVLEGMLKENRLVHAINLEGEPGSGRKTVAMAVAGTILCQKHGARMCGECPVCRRVIQGVHPDIMILDGKDGSYKKDSVRELRQDIYRSPTEGTAKILILSEAQNMTDAVQNLLLKAIEEPPPDTCIILTCENRTQLLGTIRSRVVTVPVRPMEQKTCREWLAGEVPGMPEESYMRAALLSGGCPGRAKEILQDAGAEKLFSQAETALKAMASGDSYHLLAVLAGYEKNRKDYQEFLGLLFRLLGSAEVREQCGLRLGRAMKCRAGVQRAIDRNERFGYAALISAALAEETKGS